MVWAANKSEPLVSGAVRQLYSDLQILFEYQPSWSTPRAQTSKAAYLGEAQLQLTGLWSGSGDLGAHGLVSSLLLHWLDCWLCGCAQQGTDGDGASLASGGTEQSGCH
jgi:hypothetical protein